MKNLLSFSLLIALLFFSCEPIEIDIDSSQQLGSVKVQVFGIIQDQNKEALEGVRVSHGTQSAITNDLGFYHMETSVTQNSTLLIEYDGYFTAHPSIGSANEGNFRHDFVLVERNLTASINSSTGGQVQIATGVELSLAGEGFELKDGEEAYNGVVNVYAHYLDPGDESITERMPGNLMGQNTENELRILETYGMFQVELESHDGKALQINKDATLSWELPADIISSAPDEIPMWSFDEESGLWKEEGIATKSGNKMTAELSHFSWWNCDIPYLLRELSIAIPKSIEPQVGKIMGCFGESGNCRSASWPIGSLTHGGVIPSSVNTTITLRHRHCGTGILSIEIPAGQDDVTLRLSESDFTLPSQETVTGTIYGCDGEELGNVLLSIGLVNSEFYGEVINAITDDQGKFEVHTSCGTPYYISFLDVIDGNNTIHLPGFNLDGNSSNASLDGLFFACDEQLDVEDGMYWKLDNGDLYQEEEFEILNISEEFPEIVVGMYAYNRDRQDPDEFYITGIAINHRLPRTDAALPTYFIDYQKSGDPQLVNPLFGFGDSVESAAYFTEHSYVQGSEPGDLVNFNLRGILHDHSQSPPERLGPGQLLIRFRIPD